VARLRSVAGISNQTTRLARLADGAVISGLLRMFERLFMPRSYRPAADSILSAMIAAVADFSAAGRLAYGHGR
jgi:hypothetical protein